MLTAARWYFDAVSTTSVNESVTIVFYEAGQTALGFPTGSLFVSLNGSFKNGTLFNYTIPVPPTGNATIVQDRDSIAGTWQDTGFSFRGTGLATSHPSYVVSIDAPALGVQGTLALQSVAPPHYPCGPDKAGESEQVVPSIWWSNAVPDATAAADLRFADGTRLRFAGNGYHDKNWGVVPLAAAVQSWYWGHARLGPYSVVWFDTRGRDGKEYFSGYVVRDGEVLEASCAEKAVLVRPWGANSVYPPTVDSGTPEGMAMTFALEAGKLLTVNVTTGLVVDDITFYQRYIGSARGGLEGGKLYAGKGFWEEFKFPLTS